MSRYGLVAKGKYGANHRERNWYHISWYVKLAIDEARKETLE